VRPADRRDDGERPRRRPRGVSRRGHGRLRLEAHRARAPARHARGDDRAWRGARRSRKVTPGRVLVVDDTELNRRLLTRLLQGIGHETEEATDGVEALARLRRTDAPPIDVVLLDLVMPNLDGHATLAQLKADDTLRD